MQRPILIDQIIQEEIFCKNIKPREGWEVVYSQIIEPSFLRDLVGRCHTMDKYLNLFIPMK